MNRIFNQIFQWLLLLFAFVWAGYYVFNTLNPYLFYFTQQPAFLHDKAFFISYLKYPGGWGAYLSLYAEQYFMFPLAGTLVMTGTVVLTAVICIAIVKLVAGNIRHFLLIGLLPLLVSVLMWHNLKYPFSINVQLLLSLCLSWVVLKLLASHQVLNSIFILVGSVLVYYMFGGPYLYLFSSLIFIKLIIGFNDKKQLVLTFLPVFLSVIIPFVFYRFITPVSLFHAWGRFSPNVSLFLYYNQNGLLYVLFGLLPALTVLYIFSQKIKVFDKVPGWILSLGVALIFVLLTISGIKKYNNKQERLVASMSVKSYECDWASVIKLSYDVNPYNRMANFYVNQAMYHTGALETNFFSVKQLLGVDGLFIEDPLVGDICMPSSYLYYQMGFVHNALRFAYEGQTLIPNSPFVLMQIIDCLIVEEQFDNAEYFLKVLNKNHLYQDFVLERRKFIAGDNVGLDRKEVESLRTLMPQEDFYASHPFVNAYLLEQAHFENKMAREYAYLYYILNNKLGDYVRHLVTEQKPEEIKLTKTFQEALILYLAIARDKRIEGSENIYIDEQVKNRFIEFNKILQKNGRDRGRPFVSSFADTYWYYTVYDSPEVTGLKVNTRKADVNY